MSLLQMMSCDGCGATADNDPDIMGSSRTPLDWLEIVGPATSVEVDEMGTYRSKATTPQRHACSPACLVDVATRLAALPDALARVGGEVQ